MMKKIGWLALALMLGLFLAGCGGDNSQAEDTSVEREFADENGSYVIPANWVKSDQYSTEDKNFYVMAGHEEDEQPDNISVEFGSNRYAAAEHMQFRDAILRQLAVQLQGGKVNLTGAGRYTDNEDVLYVFTLNWEDDVVSRQYYVVGEKKYVFIHLTNFTGSEEADAAAERMATSFVWADADSGESAS